MKPDGEWRDKKIIVTFETLNLCRRTEYTCVRKSLEIKIQMQGRREEGGWDRTGWREE